MTSSQKVIKNIAIIFAIFLSVSIICGILTGGYTVIKSIGLIKIEESKLLDSLVTISDNNEYVTSLELKIKVSNLKITNGEKFEVKTNNPYVTFINNNGKVVIEENNESIWPNSSSSDVIMYIPNQINELDKVKIESGIGKLYIENITAKKFELDSGVGEAIIDVLTVLEETKIKNGVGKLNINLANIKDADFNLGVGETIVTGDVFGNSKFDTGIGSLNLILNMDEQNYKIKVDKGLGVVKYNGSTVSNNEIIGNGKNYIKIEGGIGSINIKTNNI